MKRIAKYKHIVLLLLILNLAGAALYVGGLYFTKNQNETASLALSEAEILEKKRHSLKAAEHLLEEIEDDMQKVDAFFVGADEVASFFGEVEDLARVAGVELTIENVSTEAIENQKSYELLTLTLVTFGSWTKTMHFLRLLEMLPIELEVNSANIGLESQTLGEDGASASPQWSGLVRISVVKLK